MDADMPRLLNHELQCFLHLLQPGEEQGEVFPGVGDKACISSPSSERGLIPLVKVTFVHISHQREAADTGTIFSLLTITMRYLRVGHPRPLGCRRTPYPHRREVGGEVRHWGVAPTSRLRRRKLLLGI